MRMGVPAANPDAENPPGSAGLALATPAPAALESAPAALADLRCRHPLPADRHPAAVYLARLASGSRRTMRHALDVIAALLTGGRANAHTLDWAAVRYQHTAAVRSALAERYAPATTNKTLAALRGVLRECWRLGLLAADEYHRAADLPAIRAETLPRGRALSGGELAALLGSCVDGTGAGARDAALLAVLYGCGLRRGELVALDAADYDRETGAVTVRSGKGRKDRVTYAPPGARAAVEDWLAIRGDRPGALFLPVRKGGPLAWRHMTAQSVLGITRRRAARAHIPRFSPHDLRRSNISDLLDSGADIATVQKLAGHANPATTARYDRRGERAKQKAAGLLHVPYVPQRILTSQPVDV